MLKFTDLFKVNKNKVKIILKSLKEKPSSKKKPSKKLLSKKKLSNGILLLHLGILKTNHSILLLYLGI